MKRNLLIAVLLATLTISCKKDFDKFSQRDLLTQIKVSLKDSLPPGESQKLNYAKAIITKVDSAGLHLIRIPFFGKSIQNEFILLRLGPNQQIQNGKIIRLSGSESEFGQGVVKRRRWDGEIQISSLNRKIVITSKVENGFITVFHPDRKSRSSNYSSDLPEVIVIAYVHPQGISYSDWIMLSIFFDNISGGGSSNYGYYSSLDGGFGGAGSGTSSGDTGGQPGGSNIPQDDPVLIPQDPSEPPAIDIDKFLKCFDNIPDQGATCSIELFTDIPVDNDPHILYDLDSRYAGHTFIQIKKSNNGQYAIQNFGFYPKSGWQAISGMAPVDGKFVDDGGHEINASIVMNLAPSDLQLSITKIRSLARTIQYDADEYNCTDFAMDIFNASRVNKLEIPMIDLPGGITAGGSRTPQGLYLKLQEMKNNNDPEASNVRVGFLKGFVATSDGPCN